MSVSQGRYPLHHYKPERTEDSLGGNTTSRNSTIIHLSAWLSELVQGSRTRTPEWIVLARAGHSERKLVRIQKRFASSP
ncbi:hypothetical protein E2C01_086478 [Portunus trituberculatus]|uniref:Uncharacterized protein n=1 Tax=Portunus trituberculatus TaxID=210409 RepID=A0A5B7J3Y4_PORTR|nr:hypothetical protein [Portunus trituberculatus]